MDFKVVEAKWQKFWEEHPELYRADDPPKALQSGGQVKPKKYILVEFPYPSGSGLHVGHAFSFTGSDVYARFERMQGYNVMFPMGWDAFGLPTENYAIKTKRKPQEVTKENTEMFKEQMKKLAFSFDWEREINTTDANYYKWTQWIFIQLFKKGLAYKKEMPINWCPSCKIGLANEEVLPAGRQELMGVCERCGTEVERRTISQWVVKITEYADKLIEGLKKTDFIEKVKQAQVNWIGKSEGAKVRFKIKERNEELEVFTTRPDTLFGATFMVIAPEHKLALELNENNIEVKNYLKETRKKSEMERAELNKEKTGVFSGLYAINPVNNKEIPIWISDFVLASYGTGAIMSVPAHDERDLAFAKKFGLEIVPVIEAITGEKAINEEQRKSIVAIVKNPKDGKLLSIDWGKLGGSLFIGGGIEEGESLVDAAVREIREETGFKNLKFLEQSEKVHHHYFAASKNVYREIEATGLFFELIDEEKEEIKLEENEKGKFKVEWVTQEEAERKVLDKLHKYVFDKFIKGVVYSGVGIMINSEEYNGLFSGEVSEKIIRRLEEKGIGERSASYHLRDWIFSRQHYWGEPIPMVNCPKDGWVPVPEKDLPIKLPEVEAYEPTEDGKSPLSKIESFVRCNCPLCGGEAQRETDTMPNWAGSDWYYLAYCFAGKLKGNNEANDTFVDIFSDSQSELKKWCPVDVYIGGDEHNTLHLLYSRFIYQFLNEIGVVPKEISEPYFKRISHGVILGSDNQRMSKSKGNVIVPETVADKYGVDVLRLYLMFMGPFEGTMAWNEKTLMGVKRFLDRFVAFIDNQIELGSDSSEESKAIINKTILGVGRDMENFGFNTVVAKLMEASNTLDLVGRNDLKKLVQMLAPLAPYSAEELWQRLEGEGSVHQSIWPEYDEHYTISSKINFPMAINGKVREIIELDLERTNDKEYLMSLVAASGKMQEWLKGKEVVKEILVPGKMLNLVVRE